MLKNDLNLRILFSLVLIIGLLYIPAPVFSQQSPELRDLMVNGDFEQGIQDFGVGYHWGAFSNGQAVVDWSTDTWDKVTLAGQSNAQMIEIKDAQALNRYAGIYQTVNVVPGQQYKLTIKGLIRSTEGDIEVSDYGYRLQYGVDYNGGTAWELVAEQDWHELPWDEQVLFDPEGGLYRFETYEATLTARNEQLTLFIRGWKKWINNGSGIFDIQAISLVGPAPEGLEASLVQAASLDASASTQPEAAPAEAESMDADTSVTAPADENITAEAETEAADKTEDAKSVEEDVNEIVEPAPPVEEEITAPANEQPLMLEPPVSTQPRANVVTLPESGQGEDDSMKYVVISGTALLLILFAGAITAAAQRRKQAE